MSIRLTFLLNWRQPRHIDLDKLRIVAVVECDDLWAAVAGGGALFGVPAACGADGAGGELVDGGGEEVRRRAAELRDWIDGAAARDLGAEVVRC